MRLSFNQAPQSPFDIPAADSYDSQPSSTQPYSAPSSTLTNPAPSEGYQTAPSSAPSGLLLSSARRL